MVSVSIQNSDGVTFTFQNSDIIKVQSIITGDIDHSTMPISGPMGAMGFDIAGGMKIIGVDGILTLASSTRTSTGTTTTILQQKQWLEAVINGNQSQVTFTSNYESKSYGSSFTNTKVIIQKLTFGEESGMPNEVPFTMNLIVAGV